ncbi:MAG: hypothetical protein Q7S98_05470 [Deltaproteobacteria bacterium]|nr:hypothetical protein [Deltaproteobacteria bacterium]
MRSLLSKMSFGILAVILTAGVLLISASFLMYGVATGLEALFVSQPWLGWVITGGVFFLGPALFLKGYFFKVKKIQSDFSKMRATLIRKIIDAIDSINIREWTRKHPYQSTGTAAAVGFIAASKDPSDVVDTLKEVLLPILLEHLQSDQKAA